jgi:hypothetical protein
MHAAAAAGVPQLDILAVVVANEIQADNVEGAVEWIEHGMFGEGQIRDFGNQLVAAFGRGEVH